MINALSASDLRNKDIDWNSITLVVWKEGEFHDWEDEDGFSIDDYELREDGQMLRVDQ